MLLLGKPDQRAHSPSDSGLTTSLLRVASLGRAPCSDTVFKYTPLTDHPISPL